MKRAVGMLAVLGVLCALPASAVSAVTELRFDNGMRVLVMADHKLPTVYLSVMFKGAGAAADPPGKAGLAVLTAELMREGTSSLTSRELADKVDFLGASLSAGADFDRLTVSAGALSRDTEAMLGLLADVIQKPAFKQEELDRVKARTLASFTQSLDDADSVSGRGFMRFLYGSHRYGLPAAGIERTVKPITREDVVAFHSQNLRADNAVMVVAGDVDPAKVQELLVKAFSTFRPGTAPAPAPLPVAAPRDVRILLLDKPDLTQAKITFGHVGIPREHPDFESALVMNGVLGGTGFLSRMVQSVRVKLGLTYSIRSSFDARKAGGSWNITTATTTSQAAAAIKATMAEIERIQAAKVTPRELQDVQGYLVGAFQLAMETPEARAGQLLTADLYNQGLDYLEAWPRRLKAVTGKDVARAAQSLLNVSTLRIVVVGNAAQLEEQLKALGTVEVRPHARWADDGEP